MKSARKFTAFISVVGDKESAGAVRWFRGDVFGYKWESYLYPDRANSTDELRHSILSISAPNRAELSSRVERIISEAPADLNLEIHEDPLATAESCKELLALGAQREGGLS